MGVEPGLRASFVLSKTLRAISTLGLLLGLLAFWNPMPVAAEGWSAPRTVYVPTTGHTTDRLFLDAWRSERALLGDPISEEFEPRTGFTSTAKGDVIQYYEHMAIVYLPDEAPGEQVQAIDLGRQALEHAQESGASIALNRAVERAVCSPTSGASCVNDFSTGHTVRGAFLTYWSEGQTAYWVGAPITEEFRAPDGTRVQYFENAILRLSADGAIAPLPLGRMSASRAQISTDPVEQPADVPTYEEELFIPPPEATPSEPTPSEMDWAFGPGPQQGTWKEIVVSISAQSMWAYEGGELMISSLVSTGTAEVPETVTPIGYHSVLVKYDAQTMEGTISDEYYRVEDVPYVMYFDDFGNAIHGTYWHNNFGMPMSHGCVNLPIDIAAWMYEWAPVGTAVTVVA